MYWTFRKPLCNFQRIHDAPPPPQLNSRARSHPLPTFQQWVQTQLPQDEAGSVGRRGLHSAQGRSLRTCTVVKIRIAGRFPQTFRNPGECGNPNLELSPSNNNDSFNSLFVCFSCNPGWPQICYVLGADSGLVFQVLGLQACPTRLGCLIVLLICNATKPFTGRKHTV